MSASGPRVQPRAKSELAEPRTIERYKREVVALLLAGRHIPRSRGKLLVKRWDKYVRARWLQGKPPCNVADHIGKFEREKLVKPARDKTKKRLTRTAFARQMRPVATRRSSRASRDADNPRMGEIYETRGGSRWQVVSTSDKLITVKRAGHRTEGPYAWGKESLKGMKQVPRPLFGVGGLFGIGATKPANETEARDPERRRRSRDPMSSIGKTLDPTWKRRPPRGQWGVFLDGQPYAWYGDKGQAVEAAKELRGRPIRGDDGKPLAVDVRKKTVRTARLGYFYKRKSHGRQKESKFGTTKYLHGHRYKYGEPYAFPGRRRKKNYAAKGWTRRDAEKSGRNSRDWGHKEPRWAWTIFNRRHGYLSELHPAHPWDSSKSSAWLFASERTAAQVIARHPFLRGATPVLITVSEGHNGKSFDPKLRTGSHLIRDPSRKRKPVKKTTRKAGRS